MLAVRPIVTVRPSFCFTRVRSCISAQVIGIAGGKAAVGQLGHALRLPEIPTYSSTMS